MKKIVYLFFFIMIIISTSPLFANSPVDISIGANVWYSWWNPPWESGNKRFAPYLPENSGSRPPGALQFKVNKYSFNPVKRFLAGPAISISFLKRWSISSVFTIGRYLAISSGPFTNKVSTLLNFWFSDSEYRKDILKYDSDTVLNCKINKYVKVFIGFKYQGYNYSETIFYVANDYGSGMNGKGKANYFNYGPGFGFGFTFPLGKSFYLLLNISGSYLFGGAEYKYDLLRSGLIDSGLIITGGQHVDEKFNAWCGNSSLSVAYYISSVNITLAIGGRYQVLYFQQEKNINSTLAGFLSYDGKFDHFYGITMSVLYSFRIGGKDK